MKRSAIIAAAVATMICSGVSAAPLTDYSTGKTSIDLTMRNTDSDITTLGGPITLGKKNNLDFGITTGLGNNFAVQYNGYNAKSKDAVYDSNAFSTYRMNGELKIQEFNVLYKVDKNVSIYTGLVTIKGSISDIRHDNASGVDTTDPYSTGTKKKIQLGLVGSTKIADKTSVYASVGVASDYTNWKIGVSQEIAPNLEFNVDYRRLQAKKLAYEVGDTSDVTVKGLGYGVTYKF